jgi:signal transduction histidine kinase
VLVACLAITPLVVPALVAFRVATGGTAWVDGQLANELLGTTVRPAVTSPGPSGFWRSGWNVLRDSAFWRQQTYLLIRLSLGFGLGIAAVAGTAAGFGLVSTPIWYRFTNAQIVPGWHVDTLGRALICVPAGIALLGLLLLVLGPLRRGARAIVVSLLADSETRGVSPEAVRRLRRRGLALHALGYAAFNLFLITIWALSGHHVFWPVWTLIVFGLPLAAHAWIEVVLSNPFGRWRAVALQGGLSAAVAVFFTAIWAASSRGYFWPVWPILVLVVAFLIHLAVVVARGGSQERIAELEETRAGAVDLQEAELERIERDLHDGAQARLVALGMTLGMAEQKLESDPVAAQALLAEARQGTHAALDELRDLARGIHPPVLTDRGLQAAVSALADRTPLRVNVSIDLPKRPPRTVETAAYFVAAEALANTGKHAAADRVDITIREVDGRLIVEVADNGVGGADPDGGGLRGLARRVGALDGRLEIESPSGGPTTIRAVIPCAS